MQGDMPAQTLKMQIKQRLRENDPTFRYYKSLFNFTSDLIAVTDGDAIIDANTAFSEFFAAQGMDIFHPDFSLSKVFQKIDKYGYVYDGYEMRRWFDTILRKEKYHYRVAIEGYERLYHFNVSVQPLAPADDIYVITLTDITEMMGYRYALEENFRSSIEDKEEAQFLLQQYDRAIDVSNLVSKSDLDGTLTYVNDAFCEALNYTREELIGDNILIFCAPDQDDLRYESVWETIEEGNIWKGVLKNVDKGGSIHHFDTTVVPIKDQRGEVVEYLSVRRDITEMVRAKEEAIQTLESKTKFFDQVSHELRTPLNAIVNFTDLALENFDEILEDEVSRDLVKMYMERAYKNAQNLLSLINSLLDMAKLKSGKETFAIEPYNVASLVQDAYESCSSLNKNSHIDYRSKIKINNIWIQCDPLKFKQILTNLISNAFKFTSEGFIEVRVSEEGDACCIEVEDSGIGIPSEKLSRIFEPFEQVRSNDHGTGLGLSIVKEYAQAMGLALNVRSEKGSGSCFTLKTKKLAIKEESEWVI